MVPKRCFVVVEVLAGLEIGYVLMMETKGRGRFLLYTKTKRERMLKKKAGYAVDHGEIENQCRKCTVLMNKPSQHHDQKTIPERKKSTRKLYHSHLTILESIMT